MAYPTKLTLTGYKDLIAKVDLSTFRRIPWENNIPFFLVSFHDSETEEPLYACPRSLLHVIVDKYAKLGLEPMCGAEYEFYNFKGMCFRHLLYQLLIA